MVIRYSPIRARERAREIYYTEKEIQQVYASSPIVTRGTSRGKPVTRYYKPTPEQQAKILELAQKLPEERRKKYVAYEEAPEERKGVAENLMTTITDVKRAIPISVIEEMTGEKGVPRWMPIAPAYGFAAPVGVGAIASVEAQVYGGERLVSHFVTHHEPVTPRPPPTHVSGVIGVALGDPTEMQKVEEYGPFYAAGTVGGDIAIAYLTGKGMEKAWSGLKKIPVVKRGPQYVEKVGTQVIKKLPKRLQRYFVQEELIGRRPTAIARQKYSAMKLGKFGVRRTPSITIENLSKSWAKGTQFVSGTAHTPFSVTLSKVTDRGGLLLASPSIQRLERTITPLITFRTIVKPNIPLISRLMLKSSTKLFTLQLPKIVPLLSLIRLRDPFVVTKQIQKVKLKQILETKQIQTQKTIQKLETKQVLRTKQAQIPKLMQISVPVFDLKKLQVTMRTKLPRFRFPEPREKRRRKGLFGEWIPREHKIAKPHEVAERFFGRRKRKREKALRFRF